LTAGEGKFFVSLFWGGLMIGRFIASVELSAMAKTKKWLLVAAIPVAAWIFLCLYKDIHIADAYAPLLIACWALFQLGAAMPARTLGLFALAVSALMVAAMFLTGHAAMWCVVGAGLFSSIGWTNTFPLALEGTGNFKSQASSLLVVGVLGGALLPPLQGKISDHTSLQFSFIVPALAYLYVSFYGWKGCRVGRGPVPPA
jgi:FHS family L-fucose permease-like MFS transporter